MENFAGAPVNAEDALGDLIANPQTVAGCLQSIGMDVRRFEELLYLGSASGWGRSRGWLRVRAFLRMGGDHAR